MVVATQTSQRRSSVALSDRALVLPHDSFCATLSFVCNLLGNSIIAAEMSQNQYLPCTQAGFCGLVICVVP